MGVDAGKDSGGGRRTPSAIIARRFGYGVKSATPNGSGGGGVSGLSLVEVTPLRMAKRKV